MALVVVLQRRATEELLFEATVVQIVGRVIA
jgi:hypothetical protein